MCRSGIVVLVIVVLLACCVGQTNAAERQFVTGNFVLTLGGVKCGFLKSVDGGGISAEVINEPAGSDFFVRKHIGQPKYEQFTLQFGFGMTSPIYNWIADSWNMNYERRNGAVIACDGDLQPKSQRDFTGALITETTIPACDGSSKEPSYMTVKFAPEYTAFVTPQSVVDTDGGPSKLEQKIWLPANFRLEIEGLDCTRVNKIDSFTVKQTAVTDDIGDARDYAKVPGKIEFPNLKITLAESTAESWKQWHDSFVIKGNNDEDAERDGSLIFLSPDRQRELARINFKNLGIFKLQPDKAEANADQIQRVTAELYCEKMDFDMSGMGAQSAAPPAEDEVLPPSGKGEWGKTYRMRQYQPLHFTLNSANYSVEPVTIGGKCFTVNGDEKLLVLHFKVKNPGKTKCTARYDMLPIAAIDGAKVSRPQRQAWGVEETGELAAFDLEPNQEVSLFNVIAVPAKGEPVTILVKSNRDNDGPELPYDVAGHVPALPAPFADPSDPTGATALQEIAAKRGAAYPCCFFSIKVEDMGFVTTQLGETRLAEGERYFVCGLRAKNMTPDEHLLRHDMLQPVLVTEARERMTYKGMLHEDNDRPVAQPLRPGEEMPVRLYFVVPKGAAPAELMIQEPKSRRYLYKVG